MENNCIDKSAIQGEEMVVNFPKSTPITFLGSPHTIQPKKAPRTTTQIGMPPADGSASTTMASNKHVYHFLLLAMLAIVQQTLASPIPRISSPEIGALSLAELFLQTFRRILELGFLQGVAIALLVLGCLVCLLICVLCALAAYVDRNNTTIWDKDLERKDHRHSSNEKRNHSRDEEPENRGRKSYYAERPSPITKISILASTSPRKTTPQSTPSKFQRQNSRSPSPTTPLRSALSKSPSRKESFFFGLRRSSRPSSPKSVRWADELGVSVLATVQIKTAEDGAEIEIDIGMSRHQQAHENEFGDDSYSWRDTPPAHTSGVTMPEVQRHSTRVNLNNVS
ncbi:hypothetical protein LTR99_010097 [Exophiala xenobiotica]|nr:hypothetical protein LTR96_006044 [Exophiala xenobiotica]KAK5293172.1 hypothetical protein LTR99_010097 [Exophiala xenobiotica]KAK5337600.1 hypothetical protein LTR98_006716 [Exophiala xenobiotica]